MEKRGEVKLQKRKMIEKTFLSERENMRLKYKEKKFPIIKKSQTKLDKYEEKIKTCKIF